MNSISNNYILHETKLNISEPLTLNKSKIITPDILQFRIISNIVLF